MDKHTLTTWYILFVSVLILFSCSGNSKKTQKEDKLHEASLIEISIGGMTCLGCEQTIQKNVGKLEGIKSVKASFTIGNAIVEYFPEKVDTFKIKEAVTGSGYTVIKFTPFRSEEVAK
jgi:copper chaperone